MKHLYTMLCLSLLFCMGCMERTEPSALQPGPEPMAIYQHTFYKNDGAARIDTLVMPQRHDDTFVLLDTTSFYLLGKEHVVRGSSNEFESATDACFYMLELDSFGMIYGHSLSWPGNYSIVHSNSDSLNRLINAALGAAFVPAPHGAHYSYERAEEARKQMRSE